MKLHHQKLSLTDRALKLKEMLKAPQPPRGRYADASCRNLYLNVSAAGTKSWVFIWFDKTQQKQRDCGLGSATGAGSATFLTLPQARSAAEMVRTQIAAGIDPIAAKAEAKKQAKVVKRGDLGPGVDARLAELRSRKPELAALLERQIDALLKSADEPLGEVVTSAQPKSELAKKRHVGRPAKPLPTHPQFIPDRKA
ncbi:Arm DNA-binding domain-containing protein [Mesorhizobium sp.]|uniref:Arm DNA-binding domain-containing protein n=1 Tax=Mesorhizobium sp. TaxID=1871066 RepID=UPI00257DBD2F|nr:Arm DNA-binding domain-containing protein [Mesorhizobium sp.]